MFYGRSLHALSLVAFALLSVFANPAQAKNPDIESLPNTIRTKQQAEALPIGSKVAMVCAKCKTVLLSEVDQQKGFLAWFSPKTNTSALDAAGMSSTPNGAGLTSMCTPVRNAVPNRLFAARRLARRKHRECEQENRFDARERFFELTTDVPSLRIARR
jgi:hypothetical protein